MSTLDGSGEGTREIWHAEISWDYQDFRSKSQPKRELWFKTLMDHRQKISLYVHGDAIFRIQGEK